MMHKIRLEYTILGKVKLSPTTNAYMHFVWAGLHTPYQVNILRMLCMGLKQVILFD